MWFWVTVPGGYRVQGRRSAGGARRALSGLGGPVLAMPLIYWDLRGVLLAAAGCFSGWFAVAACLRAVRFDGFR